MVCNVIDECRCYAYRGETKQFCGVRRGPNILPCPDECCHGGCTGEPFMYIDRRPKPPFLSDLEPGTVYLFLLFTVATLLLLLNIDLKIMSKRKI